MANFPPLSGSYPVLSLQTTVDIDKFQTKLLDETNKTLDQIITAHDDQITGLDFRNMRSNLREWRDQVYIRLHGNKEYREYSNEIENKYAIILTGILNGATMPAIDMQSRYDNYWNKWYKIKMIDKEKARESLLLQGELENLEVNILKLDNIENGNTTRT